MVGKPDSQAEQVKQRAPLGERAVRQLTHSQAVQPAPQARSAVTASVSRNLQTVPMSGSPSIGQLDRTADDR